MTSGQHQQKGKAEEEVALDLLNPQVGALYLLFWKSYNKQTLYHNRL